MNRLNAIRLECRALIILLALGASTGAIGETWYVEKDGSGEFTIIQEAVDAAANGDTIRIGPGRYSEFEEVNAPGWTEPAVVWINKDGLVLIGSGAGETRIGPESYYDPGGIVPKVICCIDEYRCTLRDLTVENCREGIYWGAGSLELHNCEVVDCELGLVAFADDGIVVNGSTFRSRPGLSYAFMTYPPTRDVSVSHCRFSGGGHGASFTGTEGVYLSDNEFACARSGISFSSSLGTIERCSAEEEVGQGVIVGDHSEVHLLDNAIYGRVNAIEVSSGSIVDASGCTFSGGINHPTIYIYATSQVNIHGCNILNGGNYSVKLQYFFDQFIEQDMTGNYWGTTDPDTVASWIWDQNDDPANFSIVNYLPMADGPVPTEEKSFGSIKAMFR